MSSTRTIKAKNVSKGDIILLDDSRGCSEYWARFKVVKAMGAKPLFKEEAPMVCFTVEADGDSNRRFTTVNFRTEHDIKLVRKG